MNVILSAFFFIYILYIITVVSVVSETGETDECRRLTCCYNRGLLCDCAQTIPGIEAAREAAAERLTSAEHPGQHRVANASLRHAGADAWADALACRHTTPPAQPLLLLQLLQLLLLLQLLQLQPLLQL